ncbi:MAG: isoprenylcysteine carboxylmethyltransferase family protein [Pseudomonadota bacterium]
MDEFRYSLALILIVIMPVVITFWLVIHLGARYWRKRPIMRAYWVAGTFIVIVVAVSIKLRATLIGTDLGLFWPLFIAGCLIYLMSWRLWKPIKQHLDFKTFAGIPEVTNQPIALITTGPFSLVRHPRYLMVLVGIIGWCLMSNYSGAYWMGLISFVGMWVIVQIEEKDLLERFGEEYRMYQQNVPQLLPNSFGMKKLVLGKF